MKQTLLLFALVFCVGFSSKNPSEKGKGGFTIAFVPARQLELEPCGCSFDPLGGFEREFNLIQSWRKEGREVLALTGGATLFPVEYEKANESLYQKKVGYLFEGIKKVGGQVVSPAAEDFYLGVDKVKELADKSDIELVSANLYSEDGKKRLFDASLEVDVPGGEALVMGISAPSRHKGVKVTAKTADEVLPEVLDPKKIANKLVILITNVPRAERERIMAKYPIHIILGANEAEESESILQPRGTQLYTNPTTRGRSVARLDLDLVLPVKEFFNETVADFALDARMETRETIAKLEKTVKAKKTPKKVKDQAAKDLAKKKEFLEAQETIPDRLRSGGTSYTAKVYLLDKSLDAPSNLMKELLDRYKKDVEKAAMKGDF